MRLLLMLAVFWNLAAAKVELSPKEKAFLSERIVQVGISADSAVSEQIGAALCKAYVKHLGDELGLWIKYNEVVSEDLLPKVESGTLDLACASSGLGSRADLPHLALEGNSPIAGAVAVHLAMRPDWPDLGSALHKAYFAMSAEDKQEMDQKIADVGAKKLSRDAWGWIIIGVGLLIGVLTLALWRMGGKADVSEDSASKDDHENPSV